MILLKLKTGLTLGGQYKKILEEVDELGEELRKPVQQHDFMKGMEHVISEAFDVKQSTNQLILDVVGEDYMFYYKKHINKLEMRAKNGIIKIDRYYDLL